MRCEYARVLMENEGHARPEIKLLIRGSLPAKKYVVRTFRQS